MAGERGKRGEKEEETMKVDRVSGIALLFVAAIGLSGCSDDNCIECVDNDPPAVPTGVFSVTGDEWVTVYWNDIYQLDLVGYAVYRDEVSPDDGDNLYDWLADVAWDENFDAVTGLHWFVDTNVVNGRTYSYAVLAFDMHGNESLLSFEDVTDTPRPEGFNVELVDRALAPALSGFDFSVGARVDGALELADIYVLWQGGAPFAFAARADVAIQDYGNVMDDGGFVNLDLLSYAPLSGWSTTGRAELIVGHAYVVRIGSSVYNYAKFAITSRSASSVVIDWAYQIDTDNRELKALSPTTGGRSGDAQVVSF